MALIDWEEPRSLQKQVCIFEEADGMSDSALGNLSGYGLNCVLLKDMLRSYLTPVNET